MCNRIIRSTSQLGTTIMADYKDIVIVCASLPLAHYKWLG